MPAINCHSIHLDIIKLSFCGFQPIVQKDCWAELLINRILAGNSFDKCFRDICQVVRGVLCIPKNLNIASSIFNYH